MFYENMKSQRRYWNLFLLAFIVSTHMALINSDPSAITYELGDRFGDNLASYCHARWLSYLHKIEFLYVPFKESQELALSRYHRSVISAKKDFIKEVHFSQNGKKIDPMTLDIQKEGAILYTVPYFAETRFDSVNNGWMHFDIDWDYEEFMKMLRSEINPIKPLPSIELPKDRITVAVHVRRGSGPDRSMYDPNNPKDTKYFVENYPLRFPHDSFFIKEIRRLSELLENQPMYVHIFTDDKHADKLIKKYKRKVNKPNIVYNTRPNQLDHSDYVLQDFFDMMSFDCIIRPESHYSQISSRLSRAKIIIRPEEYIWKGMDIIITKVETLFRKESSSKV